MFLKSKHIIKSAITQIEKKQDKLTCLNLNVEPDFISRIEFLSEKAIILYCLILLVRLHEK